VEEWEDLDNDMYEGLNLEFEWGLLKKQFRCGFKHAEDSA
jgi:hypothetical protein